MPPTEVGWMLSDLSYIGFNRSWAVGFAQLLKKLQSIDTPRPLGQGGRTVVTDWFAQRDAVQEKPERLWSNLLPIQRIPDDLLRITVASPPATQTLANWPHHAQSEVVFWAFEVPPNDAGLDLIDVEPVPWHLYFPTGLVDGDRLRYVTYDGRQTYVNAVGERTFRVGPFGKNREKTRYHLSPTFRPSLGKYQQPVVHVQMRLYLADLDGHPLESRKPSRRRKAIGKNWWNPDWLARLLAVASWLGDGKDETNLATAPGVKLLLATRPISVRSPVGIDESELRAKAEDDEEVELTEEGGADDDGDAANGEAA